MTVNTNGMNENNEGIDTQNKKNIDIKQEFLKNFRDYALSKDKKIKESFISSLVDSSSLDEHSSASFLLKEFKELDSNQTKYSSLDLKDINNIDLKEKFALEVSSLELNRKTLKNQLFKDLKITEKDYNDIIFPEIKKFSEEDFYDLLKTRNSKAARIKKIKEIYTNAGKKHNKVFKIPETINLLDSSIIGKLATEGKRILLDNSIPKSKKDKFAECLASIQDWGKNNRSWNSDMTANFATLLELNLLPVSVFQDLLDKFYPEISLGYACNIGLVDEKAKYQYYENELGNIAKEINSIKDLDEQSKKILIKQKAEDKKLDDNTFIQTKVLTNTQEKVDLFISGVNNLKNIKNSENSYRIADRIGYEMELDYDERVKNSVGGEISDLKGVYKALSQINSKFSNIEGLDKLGDNSVFEVKINGVKKLFKIDYINSQIGEFSISNISNGKIINLSGYGDAQKLSFAEFVDFFKNEKASTKFFTEQEFKDKMDDVGGNLKVSELNLYGKGDLKNSKSKDKIYSQYKKAKNNELDKLLAEYELLDEEEKKKDTQLKLQIENLQAELDNITKLEQLEEIEEKLTSKDLSKEERKSLSEKEKSLRVDVGGFSIDDETLLGYTNFSILLSKIDLLDEEGRDLGLKAGETYIETEDGAGHLVVGVDEGSKEIILKTNGQGEYRVSYDDFYEAFKSFGAKRVKKINDFSSFIDVLSKEKGIGEEWSKNEFKDGKFVSKEENAELKSKEIEYLLSEKDDSLIKIERISGDFITIRYGKKEKKGKGDKQIEKILLSNSTTNLSLNDFKRIVASKENKYVPSIETGKQKNSTEEGLLKDMHKNLLGALWNAGMSVETFLKGGKMLVDGIKYYLNKETDLKSAEFAGKLGNAVRLVSPELADQLMIKVEGSQGEASDKSLSELKKIDSWAATERIEKRLLNRNTPEYKKEAGLLFMLENYGVLNGKSGLAKYSGKYLWYQAFGGRVGDKFFESMKKECEESGITFSEEFLMYSFTKKQGGPKGFNGIKRRSRLYKEFDGKWSAGIKGDYEKGEKDAGNKRLAKDMVAGGVGDIRSGNIPSVMGWLNKAVGRGASLEKMSEGFFCLLYSGALYDTDQKTFLKIKDFWEGQGMPIVMTRFSTTKPDMILFNKTVLELSKRIEELDSGEGKYKGMGKEAEELFDMATNKRGKVELASRVDKVQAFWGKYGKVLSRSLHMVHTTDTEFAMTDKIIKVEKEKNKVFGEYYSQVREFTTLGNIFDKNYMDDACGAEGVSGMNTSKIVGKWLKQSTNGFADPTMGKSMWRKISSDLDTIAKVRMAKDDKTDLEYKKKYIIHELRDIIGGMVSSYSLTRKTFHSIMDTSTEIGASFNKWGLDIFEFVGRDDGTGKKFNAKEIATESNQEVNALLEKIAMNIINGTGADTIGFKDFAAKYNSAPLKEVVKTTSSKADRVLAEQQQEEDEY